MQRRLVKLDEEGQYCYYPGVTVVSAVKSEDLETWKELYDMLQKCEFTKQYYSWLPFESYHMTTLNLYTLAKVGAANWEEFINENLVKFQKLSKVLDQKTFSPDIELMELEVSGRVIVWNLKLSAEQDVLNRSIADEFEYTDKIPRGYHLTLGYSYKQPSKETLKAIDEELKPLLTYLGKKFKLEPPKLCYFNDMKKFTPWNGDKNPF